MTTAARDLVPLDDVTPDVVKAAFEAALYAASVNESGVVVVRGVGMTTWVMLNQSAHWIRFFASFRLKPEVGLDEILVAVNSFNEEYLVARAYFVAEAGGDRAIVFDADMTIDGGLVLLNMLKRFRTFEISVNELNPLRPLLA